MRRTAALAFVLLSAFAFASDSKIKAIGDHGTIIFLTNGDAYEIRVENRQKAASWPKGETVTFYTINDRSFPYRLVIRAGRDDADVIAANKLERTARNKCGFTVTGN